MYGRQTDVRTKLNDFKMLAVANVATLAMSENLGLYNGSYCKFFAQTDRLRLWLTGLIDRFCFRYKTGQIFLTAGIAWVGGD